MKQLLLVLGVLIAVTVVIWRAHHNHYSGWSMSAGGPILKTVEAQSLFDEKFNDWVEAHDFVPAADPGGMTSWAGLHSPGESAVWYEGSYKGSPKVLLRVINAPVGPDFRQIRLSHSWSIRGSESHIENMRSLSRDMTNDLVKEFDGKNFVEQVAASDP